MTILASDHVNPLSSLRPFVLSLMAVDLNDLKREACEVPRHLVLLVGFENHIHLVQILDVINQAGELLHLLNQPVDALGPLLLLTHVLQLAPVNQLANEIFEILIFGFFAVSLLENQPRFCALLLELLAPPQLGLEEGFIEVLKVVLARAKRNELVNRCLV